MIICFAFMLDEATYFVARLLDLGENRLTIPLSCGTMPNATYRLIGDSLLELEIVLGLGSFMHVECIKEKRFVPCLRHPTTAYH